MGVHGVMSHAVGVAAFAFTTSLSCETLAQTPPPEAFEAPVAGPAASAPPAASVPWSVTARPAPSAETPRPSGPVISERLDWTRTFEGRLAIYAVFAAIVIGLGGSILWTVHRHKDEGDGQ